MCKESSQIESLEMYCFIQEIEKKLQINEKRGE
jgi:hypothetical protein